jgi:hypothetical protein
VIDDVRSYSGFDALWQRFLPETPFGRAAKERAVPITEEPALEAAWDRTDAVLGLLEELDADRVRLDRIAHHLRRLPRFPEEPRDTFDEVELFQLKKFLFNHGSLLSLLPDSLKEFFCLREIPGGLGELLGTGRQGDESFHVADAYDPELAVVRQALRDNEAAARALRDRSDHALRERWGFAFEGRAFLRAARPARRPLVRRGAPRPGAVGRRAALRPPADRRGGAPARGGEDGAPLARTRPRGPRPLGNIGSAP